MTSPSKLPPEQAEQAKRKKRVLIASDHAGFEMKAAILAILADPKELPGWEWRDLGPSSAARTDYPDFAERLARAIVRGEATCGILICGSGIGMSIAANKIPGIRAAAVENPVAARLSREHNDANVLCLGSRFLATPYAAEIGRTWLNTPFSQDPRHQQRLRKISRLEVESRARSRSKKENGKAGRDEIRPNKNGSLRDEPLSE